MRLTNNRTRQCEKFGIACVVYFLAYGVSLSRLGYRINSTPSLPMGIWKVNALSAPLCREQIVSVAPPDTTLFQLARSRHYLDWGSCPGGYSALLKPVVAIPGDRVTITMEGISVNGHRMPNSKPLATDRVGRPLTPVKFGTYEIKPGTVWLLSNSPQSFDSRYFGALPSTHILGSAHPIWIGGKSQ